MACMESRGEQAREGGEFIAARHGEEMDFLPALTPPHPVHIAPAPASAAEAYRCLGALLPFCKAKCCAATRCSLAKSRISRFTRPMNSRGARLLG